jgi:hypothetical protein
VWGVIWVTIFPHYNRWRGHFPTDAAGVELEKLSDFSFFNLNGAAQYSQKMADYQQNPLTGQLRGSWHNMVHSSS